MPLQDLLSFDDPVFASYVYYSSLVTLKMFGVALMTSFKRLTTGTYANQEDVDGFSGKKGGKVVLNNDNLERVRRNHLNDLENITPFIMIGLLYVLSKPNPSTAIWHFRVFAVSRFLHTICYQVPVPQPSRAFCFLVGLGSCVSMAAQLVAKTW